jgi:ABC-type sugar transport system substrate-binding protein
MKRKIVLIIVVVLASAVLATCSKKESGSETSGQDDKKELVLGLAWGILDDGQTRLTNAVIDILTHEYPQYNIKYTLTNADGKITTLISDVESLLAKKPDLIYIMNSVGDNGVIPAIDACIEAGVPVGIGVAIPGDIKYSYLYEGFDQYSCGLVQAQWMEEYYSQNSEKVYKVAYVKGDAGNSSSDERRNGFVENFVNKHDNVELVIEANCNWVTGTAQATAEDWLIAHPELNVIACANDDMAQGVINACIAAGRDDILVLGIDGNDVGLANVRSGAQAMTCSISFVGVAKGCAQAMIDCVEGKLESSLVSLGTKNLIMVTKDNIDTL